MTTKMTKVELEPVKLQVFEGYVGAWDKEDKKSYVYRVATDGDIYYHVPMARVTETRPGRWVPSIYVYGVVFSGGFGMRDIGSLEQVRGKVEAVLNAHWIMMAVGNEGEDYVVGDGE